MNSEVIKSFLVGLGFDIDEAGLAKFNKAVVTATIKVVALSAAITATAAAVAKSIVGISQDFEQMGYEYHIIAPAINKAIVLRRELLKAYSAAGINISKVVVASVKLNMSITKTKFALEAIYKSVGSRFFGLLTKESDIFRNTLYKNMPKILNALDHFVKFIFKALAGVIQLGKTAWSLLTIIYDFFLRLDKATDGWSTKILGLIAAWKLLNLSFLATPLGMLLAGLLAILALYDDFKVWQEGGKSFFNWSSFLPVIATVKEYLTDVWEVLQHIGVAIAAVVSAFINLAHGNFKGFGADILDFFKELWGWLKAEFSLISDMGKVIGSIVDWTAKLVGNGPNLLNPVATGAPNVAPLGVGGQNNNSLTNQHVNQQTTINVNGSADAFATSKAVASQQSNVNFDLTRNLKGATR